MELSVAPCNQCGGVNSKPCKNADMVVVSQGAITSHNQVCILKLLEAIHKTNNS